MGDRVSISFVDGQDESIALFAHWGGRKFPRLAEKYIKELDKDVPKGSMYPLERREPNIVMVDFVKWLVDTGYFGDERVMSSYYFGATCDDGDNSDNGHWKIDVNTGEAE
jgi:hypothetical protein